MSSSVINKVKEIMEGDEDLLKIPAFGKLIALLEEQSRELEQLKAEIKRLKGHPGKPVIRPSSLEKEQNKNKTNVKNARGFMQDFFCNSYTVANSSYPTFSCSNNSCDRHS